MGFIKKHYDMVNGQEVVYQGRAEGGKKVLSPHPANNVQTVQAFPNIALAVIKATQHTGDNITVGIGLFGKPYIVEYYQGGFEDRFAGKKCYVYKLPLEQFAGKSKDIVFSANHPVKVIQCVEIKDMGQYLLQLEKQRKLKIKRYKTLSGKKKADLGEQLKETLWQYLDFKELSKAQFEKLTKEEQKQYKLTKARRDFAYKKYPEVMKYLETKK